MRRAGRAGSFSFGLIVGFLLLGYAALRALEYSPRAAPAAAAPDAPEATPPARPAFHARVELGGVLVLARLLPLHDEPALEEFRAQALRGRYGLPEGAPWRLYLTLAEPAAAPPTVLAARVGAALVPFAELVPAPDGPDPVHALLAAAPGPLSSEHARPLVLWGSAAAAGSELELVSAEARGVAPLEPLAEAEADAPRWYAGTRRDLPGAGSAEQEIARLNAELERERARRLEREQTFLEFSRLVAELPAGRALGLGPPAAAAPPPTPEELEAERLQAAARARAEEIGRALAVLMRLEGLRGLDLLEAGTLLGDPPAAIGPVVFRVLDERGLLAGSVRAERLRLEGSVAAHTLTLVLEDGWESRGGEHVPFGSGVRRITLERVDPEPWQRDCPELFGGSTLVAGGDDGLWPLGEVRRDLNRLLALDTRVGWYRLHSLGGVRAGGLLDVQLEELSSDGRLERRLFCDRLELSLEDGSVVLELEDGAFVRGGEKAPFRDGRHRIVLPGVQIAAWRSASLPGLSAPPARKPGEAAPGER